MSNRMVENFIEMVEIDSEAKNEAKMHAYLNEKFTSLGLDVFEDDTKEKTGLGAGNMIATWNKASDKPAVLFSCHTDTVTPGIGIEVKEENGVLYSATDTILAADDKAGIAIMIEAIKRIKEEGIETCPIEFVLHPGEEIGLVGSSAMDMSILKSKVGYVLDSAGRIGNVTVGSPSLYMYEVDLHGKPAHSGLEPEKGISCVSIFNEAFNNIEIGRLDEETTANIGVVQGGQSTNVVMEAMHIKGEVRSISDEKATRIVNEVEQAFKDAAAKFGGTADFTKDKKATGFRIASDTMIMQKLNNAGANMNLEIKEEVSGGGSDANVFNANGIQVVNLAIGYDKIHTLEENIAIKDMETTVQLVMEIIKEYSK